MDDDTKKLLRDKAKKVKDKALADYGTGGFAVDTVFGQVQIQSLNVVTDSAGVDFIDVRLGGDIESGESHFRIYNPPLLAQDPTGRIRRSRGGRIVRYKENPVVAVAEAIAMRGGRQKGHRPA